MASVVLDTSVLIAIRAAGPEAGLFVRMPDVHRPEISAATLHEARWAARRSGPAAGTDLPTRLVELAQARIFPCDEAQLAVARGARLRYGRGTGAAAGLGMGGCFSSASAESRGLPLLQKGDDFAQTGIRSALVP